MFFNNLLKSGWLHALFIAVISYPFASMSQKLVASYTEVNILAYTGVFMLVSAITLLIMAGPGELASQTLKRFETWLYSVLQITSYILFLYSVAYATATQGATLAMLGGVFIFIFSIAFLKQKTNKYEILGCLIMCIGLYYIIALSGLSMHDKVILSLIVIVRGLVISFQKIITEIHKTNRKATTFKSQMRVTGFIMAVASFVYLVFLCIIASLKYHHEIAFFSHFPHFEDFMNFDMILFSLFVGGFVVSTTKYCEFYAGKSIGAKYLTSITSLQIIFVYFIEKILAYFNVVEPSSVSNNILWPLALVLIGNFIISVAGFIKDFSFIKKGEKQDTLANLDGNYLDNEEDFNLVKFNVANLLTLYDNDIEKLAKDLKVNKVVLSNVDNFEFDEFKMQTNIANKINKYASKNVAVKDKLTKAYNRYYLDYCSANLFKDGIDFKLYYLDLNKFKPVNDNFGHDAGDYVLTVIANRLMELSYFNNNVFRIGGDEFILIQTNNLDKNLSSTILRTIEQPISFKDYTIDVSGCVGIANSDSADSLKDALIQADNAMLKCKKAR